MLGMTYEELYDMLPKHFWIKLGGFYELENIREKQHWSRVRWSTCLLMNMHIGKGKRLKPTDLFKFPEEEKGKDVDFEKLKARAEYIKKMTDEQ